MAKATFMVAAIVVLTGCVWPGAGRAATLEGIVKRARSDIYVAPKAADLLVMRSVVRSLLDALERGRSLPERLIQDAGSIGFEVAHVEADGQPYVVLRELEGHETGGGIYVFLTGHERGADGDRRHTWRSHPVIVQAPHSRYDVHTREIGLHVFRRIGAMAFMANTAHRYADNDNPEADKADLCHTDGSYFQALTEVLADQLPAVTFVQFHGYGRDDHPELAESIRAVLSDTRDSSAKSPLLWTASRRLTAVLGEGSIGIYGVNVATLGGTTNVQGRYIRSRSTDDLFLHVEMSDPLRSDAMADSALIDALADAFEVTD